MKRLGPVLLLTALIFAACAGQKNRIIFRPDPAQNGEKTDPLESWLIIESQNGPGEYGMPEWVSRYFEDETRGIESLDRYSGKYVFIGNNRGENIYALRQWANGFTVLHDLPGLVAVRVERRLVASASLYPDDEYGQYFESLIKKVSDGEYPGAIKEETYWVKRMKIPGTGEDDFELPQTNTVTELYEYLVLISADTEALQSQLRQIMTGIKTTVPPAKDQAAAINKVQQTFFEGF